jgi:hypothetical protein
MPGTYEPIATITANGSTNTFTFSSIPSTYTDLIISGTFKNSQSGGSVNMRFNSDTGSNYSRTGIYGTGSSVVSFRSSNATYIEFGGTNPDIPLNQWHIFNYSSTSVNKTVLVLHSEPSRLVVRGTGLWRSTSAISSVEITTQSNLDSGNVITLYGIKAA